MKLPRIHALLKGLFIVGTAFIFTPMAQSMPLPKWTFDTTKVNPERNLHLYKISRKMAEKLYDEKEGLLWTPSYSKETKTIVPGSKKHMIRESAYYAYALLLTGDKADKERAEKILRRILEKQELRPDCPTKGIFAWYLEDDLEKILKPDVNSSAFVGLTLADIVALDRERKILSDDLRPQVEKAMRLSVEHTIRRNVNADYTNITILSVALASGGAKYLGMAEAGAFAQKKMKEMLDLSKPGLFPEYLSPTYTGVDVAGAYMAQKMAFSPEFNESCKTLIDLAWKEVAMAFHAPTLQLAGPHSRSYGDDLRNYSAFVKHYIYLARPEGYPILDEELQHAHDFVGLLAGVDLPISFRPEFSREQPAWITFTAAPQPGKNPPGEMRQYREGNFVLGTVEHQDAWTQRRNLVAYWRNEGDGIGGFRLGVCMEKSTEPPPAQGWVKGRFYSKQNKKSALVALTYPVANIPNDGGSYLQFSSTAIVEGENPIVVRDGAITTYLYPISATGTAKYTTLKNNDGVSLARSWSGSDSFGNLKVMSYLIVFRNEKEPRPSVSELILKVESNQAEVKANIDGERLSLPVVP